MTRRSRLALHDPTLGEARRVLLEEYRCAPPFELCPVPKGLSHVNVEVRVAGKPRFVLRSPRPGGEARFAREIALQRWLTRRAPWHRTARLILARRTRAPWVRRGARVYALMEHVAGVSVKPRAAGERPLPGALIEVGRATAELHAALARWPRGAPLPTDYGAAVRHELRALAAFLAEPRRERQRELRALVGPLRRPLCACLEAWEERWQTLPCDGVIHGDLRFANLLFDGPALVAVLDYETVGRAPLALEHATALRNLVTMETPDDPAAGTIWRAGAEAYLEGYASARGARLTRAERDEIHALLPLATLRELAFVLCRGAGLLTPRRRRDLLRVALAQVVAYGLDSGRTWGALAPWSGGSR